MNAYVAKQNPFKNTAAPSSGMQQHVQYVNQPHHLVMSNPNIGLSEESLNL